MSNDKMTRPPVEPIATGLKGHCPRCGRGRLFSNFITVARECGPAVFVILIIGFIVVGLALWLEVSAGPPLWVHFALWIPLTLGLSLGALRLAKGVLITLQYANSASEGRWDRPE